MTPADRVGETVRSQDGGDAVHGCVLDSGVGRIGTERVRCVAGERAGDTESARQEERRSGKSMVTAIAHVWIIEEVVPANGGNPGHTNLLAGAGRIRAAGRTVHPAYAKDTDRDECAISHSAQRPERSEGHEDPAFDGGRRAGWKETG